MSDHPRVRANLRFVEQTQNGATVHIVKDPLTLKYFRFGEREVGLMQLMNGQRSLSQLVDAAREVLNMATNEAAVERFVLRLKDMGLVERTQAERSALLMEFARRSRASRARGEGSTLLRMRFSLGDPDVLLGRMDRALSFCFTRGFLVVSAALFAVYALVVGTHWPAFAAGLSVLTTPQLYTPGFIIMLYVSALVIFVIHEFGHGVTCKHYGGEVHEMGVMLIYFMPAFYCNVNDAWTFESRAQRLWVTASGGWIQLIVAALSAILWMLTESGTVLHDLAFLGLVIGGGLTILLNFNPLIPLDGYYALVDWLGIPNLRARAFGYLGALIRQKLLRTDVPLPAATPREARIFVAYAILSQIYVITILSTLALALGKFFGHKWGAWGLVIFFVLMWRMTHHSRASLTRAVRALDVRSRARTFAARINPRFAAAALILIALPFVLPWTVRVRGNAVVEPQARFVYRAAEDARVDRVLVAHGDVVNAGAVLAVLRNPQLEMEWTRTQAAVTSLEREVQIATRGGDYTASRAAELELMARRAMLERLRVRRAALVMRAAFAGRVVTPRPDDLSGAALEAGDSLLELHRAAPLQARVYLTQRDAGDLDRGDVVRIKFPVRAAWTWQSPIADVSSAARNGLVELTVPLARTDGDGPLRAGMTGVAKVRVKRTTVAGAILRHARRTVRTDLWL